MFIQQFKSTCKSLFENIIWIEIIKIQYTEEIIGEKAQKSYKQRTHWPFLLLVSILIYLKNRFSSYISLYITFVYSIALFLSIYTHVYICKYVCTK